MPLCYDINMADDEIRAAAIEFAKRNKMRIARELTDLKTYTLSEHPISVFMAGSPGAGKTEYSKSLISLLEEEGGRRVIRIDGDEVRSLIPGYTGKNSHLFQGAISLIVEKVHDLALHQNQNFVLDGTFSRYEKAVDNINRSIKKNRPAFVFYVYQRPELAWKFTQARETVDGRRVPKPAFIEQFLGARATVEHLSQEFNNRLSIFLVKKDFEKNAVEQIVRITPSAPVDEYIPERYTQEDLEKLL